MNYGWCNGQRWTLDREVELAFLFATGLPYSQIARHLGISTRAATGKGNRMRLGRRKVGNWRAKTEKH